ncbi:MAG: hypothetical protein ACTSX9_01760 [Candidatus Njordarchaeales archaeon]
MQTNLAQLGILQGFLVFFLLVVVLLVANLTILYMVLLELKRVRELLEKVS